MTWNCGREGTRPRGPWGRAGAAGCVDTACARGDEPPPHPPGVPSACRNTGIQVPVRTGGRGLRERQPFASQPLFWTEGATALRGRRDAGSSPADPAATPRRIPSALRGSRHRGQPRRGQQLAQIRGWWEEGCRLCRAHRWRVKTSRWERP